MEVEWDSAGSVLRDLVTAMAGLVELLDRMRWAETEPLAALFQDVRSVAMALAELARVARGAVILSVPHEPYFQAGNLMRGKYLSGWGNHPEHVQHWNPASFERFLRPVFGEVRVVEAFPWLSLIHI